ncbi:methyl-accepting chemotaxis sensory transducer [Arcobacter nitrofigilis DSM 7299]|uniref:Methyl-accepting chemotaxis sensory transducer n=1 Tax=Arcobacter nitrofigilis (strain ATCC 33309 / DSM 7299 / CCUG 15893 / LMG 7604 / NCTC 12251 / CI) TaxID=572480 RepID=D5V211_ARCNC|nr:methyl-accepting chemotaxis protein [Arcobacter nitrofigilis]ADG93595.1 methyl-accepting chemotaxis sensory transducer [Arcobacter nitrofigilis DSM 7299]
MFFNNSSENKILEIFDNLEKFVDGEINSIPKIDYKSSGFNQKIIDKLSIISEKMCRKNEAELLVFGEIMLIAEKLSDGYISDKIHYTNTSNKKLNYIAKTINNLVDKLQDMLGSNLHKITYVLDKYAKLDFTSKIENESGKLVLALNNVTDLISQILYENKSNGLTLDYTSNELLENVQKLNESSTSAAASIEETAAAIEEITGNIRLNTETIVKMSEFSNEVTSSVHVGEELANKTTIAMDEINTQVSSINEAITIIDQIAFQTNILSLNAAVEAATAGEAGKGFAVVAAEVRNLASRSAEAAKEIKKIVESANLKANYGKSIADEMKNGYKLLYNNVSQTTELISDIETASREQLLGIEQINHAVNLLDRQTQENANIASKTNDMAMITDEISKLIVSKANEKEFIGKELAKMKSI